MTIRSTAARRKARAANNPPNPQPTTTTRGSESEDSRAGGTPHYRLCGIAYSAPPASATCRFLIERHHFRHQALEPLDASLRGRMRAQEFGRGTLRGAHHLLPYADRGVGVVPGARHQLQADDIRLCFLFATVRQLKSNRCHRIGDIESLLAGARHDCNACERDLLSISARHALAGVLPQGVRDLVPDYRGQLGIR